MLLLISAVSFSAWIYLVTFRGTFWRSAPILQEQRPASLPSVTVVVPARNEAQNIEASLTSLLTQDYPGQLFVLLIDDNSTDDTLQIATSLSCARLAIIHGQPLAFGWTGKLWAVHQGLLHPRAQAAEYVLLTDADIQHGPAHISALVAKAESDSLDLVSEMVRLNCSTIAERAFIPAFVFFFQMLYPFAWVADSADRTAAAAGGTMLVRRTALDRVDGVTRFRHQLIDDCALASELKSNGGRIWLGHAEAAVSLRIYADWRDIWDMIARTAYVQLNRSPMMLVGCIAGMSLVYLAPPLLTIFARQLPQALGAFAWLLMAASLQPTLHRYRRSSLWGLVLPAIALFYLGATVASAWRDRVGRGGAWKDRVYPENPNPVNAPVRPLKQRDHPTRGE